MSKLTWWRPLPGEWYAVLGDKWTLRIARQAKAEYRWSVSKRAHTVRPKDERAIMACQEIMHGTTSTLKESQDAAEQALETAQRTETKPAQEIDFRTDPTQIKLLDLSD